MVKDLQTLLTWSFSFLPKVQSHSTFTSFPVERLKHWAKPVHTALWLQQESGRILAVPTTTVFSLQTARVRNMQRTERVQQPDQFLQEVYCDSCCFFISIYNLTFCWGQILHSLLLKTHLCVCVLWCHKPRLNPWIRHRSSAHLLSILNGSQSPRGPSLNAHGESLWSWWAVALHGVGGPLLGWRPLRLLLLLLRVQVSCSIMLGPDLPHLVHWALGLKREKL